MRISIILSLIFILLSISTADISGFVTDTGTTPIMNAVVQLEKDGETTTTGSDGYFKLNVSVGNNIKRQKGLFQGNYSVRMRGNMVYITVPHKEKIAIETCDLAGKMISKMKLTLDAGCKAVELPLQGTGIYIHRIKVGPRVLLLKGNSLNGGRSKKHFFEKRTQTHYQAALPSDSTSFCDIISVKKDDYLNYRIQITTFDTSDMAIKMIPSAGSLTDIDGNTYQTVKIGSQVWMTENLRVTKFNDGSPLQFLSDSTEWSRIYDSSLTTSAYCYPANTTDADSIKRYGVIYNGFTVSSKNSKKIAPEGWHVPSNADWDTLQNYLIANGYNWDGNNEQNGIAQSLAANAEWEKVNQIYFDEYPGYPGYDFTLNNKSGFSALPVITRTASGTFNTWEFATWWSTTESTPSYLYMRSIQYGWHSLTSPLTHMSFGSSIRLVKNSD